MPLLFLAVHAVLALITGAELRITSGETPMHPAAVVLHEQVTKGETPGLQFLHFTADSILFRYQDGVASVAQRAPVSRATTFNGFSVTKTATAVAILQLVETGELGLDAPAANYLPDFPYPKSITIRNLLTHTAGIPNPIPLRWTHLTTEHAAFDRNAFFRQVYAQHPNVAHAANDKFAYSNLGYELLGEIIEAVSGVTYEEYVSEHILARIGVPADELGFVPDAAVHASGYHKRMSLSYPLLGFLMDRKKSLAEREDGWQRFRPYYMNGAAYGGLSGTADGFAKYVQALLDPGSGLLAEKSRALLFAENLLNDGKASGMALAWFIGSVGGERYLDHAGGGGGYYAELRIYPRLGRGSVLLFNRTGMTNAHFLDRVDRHLIGDAAGGRVHAAGMPGSM